MRTSNAADGAIPKLDDFVDDVIDDMGTVPVSVPADLDDDTIAIIARIQEIATKAVADAEARASRAAADAEFRAVERIASDFESLAGGRAVLIASDAVAARVRSMAWALNLRSLP